VLTVDDHQLIGAGISTLLLPEGDIKNILGKVGANDRTHAVTIGLKRGIIEL